MPLSAEGSVTAEMEEENRVDNDRSRFTWKSETYMTYIPTPAKT